nr:uncharacterized protein LOC129454266 [Misgurnus anguillicaudatus]
MLRNTIYKSALFYLFLLVMNGVIGDPDEVKALLKSVSVMEGDSVTLNTDITDIQRDDQILWMFGPKETRIAEIYKQGIDMFSSKEPFGDLRLLLDSQTGSLTIRNIRTEHTGLYKLQIRSDRGNSDKRFNVTVYAPLPVPVISSNSSHCSSSISNCSLLCSVLNVRDLRDVSLSWYKGNSLLSSISLSDLNIRLSLPLEVKYQDNNTYSCVVNNPITNQTQYLNINDVCVPCSEEHLQTVMLAAIISLAIILIVLAVIMFIRWKIKREHEEGKRQLHLLYCVLYKATSHLCIIFQKANGTEETIYSSVVTGRESLMLRSDTLMLDNKLFPLYQDRLTSVTFDTEHSKEQFKLDDDDDEEHCDESLMMTGTGVFGVDGDEVKSVSVMEGDSVTLHTDITEILSRDHILWMFGPQETRIAELYKQSIDMFDSNKIFGDRRLLLDSQTGSLTIRNIRNEHSGLYKLQIRKTSIRAFSTALFERVFGVDEVKSVSVMEGDSVTLQTDINEIHQRDHILWMFGSNETRIAELYKQSIDMFDSNKTFGDRRLLLNSQSGSLTIRNIRTEHTGLYKLQIRSDRGHSDKRFNVTVYGLLPIPVISRDSSQCSSSSSSSERSSSSKCLLLCSVLNVRDVSLSWYKGNSLLSSISVSDLNIRLSLEVKYQDNNTYSCVVNNTITNQTQHLNITHLCQPCPEQSHVNRAAVIPVVVVLMILLVVLIILCRKYKRKPKKGKCQLQLYF